MFSLFKLDIDYSKRTYGLDVLRAIAIIEVMIVHGGIFLNPLDTNFPWIPLLNGVELFFVLSGFLIGSILIKTITTEGISIPVTLRFYKRRWFRTLPNYYLVLLLNIIFVYFAFNKNDITKLNYQFFFFLQNFNTMFSGFFWESWSITIEEWFYLLFPIIVLISALVFKKQSAKFFIGWGILLFLCIPFAMRISALRNESLWAGVNANGVVIYKLDSIAFGILGAFIKAYYKEIWYKYKNVLFVFGLLIFYIYAYWNKTENLMIWRVFNNWIISFCILLLLPKADSIKSGKTVFSKCVTHLSLISYSMYLLNFGLICQVISSHYALLTATAGILTYTIFWCIVILLSTLLYKYFEKPIMDLRDK